MNICNENWWWSRAAKVAWELSKCNPDTTFYVEYNRLTENWCILDWKPERNDNRWDQFESGTALRNGERV